MHILFITNDLAYFRAHRETLALDLLAAGHRVTVAAGVCDGVSLVGWHDAMALVELDLDRHHFRLLQDVKLIIRLRALCLKLRPDAVHAITIKPVLYGGLACTLLPATLRESTNLVWTFAGLGKIFEPGGALAAIRRVLVRTALSFAARRTSAVATFENDADRQTMVKNRIVPADRAHTLMGTGIDLDFFAAKRTAKGPLTFLLATRLINAKGVDTYLSAAAEMRSNGIEARFLLAGLTAETNPDAVDPVLLDEAHKNDQIEFLGPVSQSDMPALLNEVDVFCLPTRLREGFPRSLLEAAACGCALIATDQVPMRILIDEAKTGWLLQKPGVDELIHAMQSALSNIVESRRMGARARDRVRRLPVDRQSIVDAFEDLYGARH